MSTSTDFADIFSRAIDPALLAEHEEQGGLKEFPFMPLGQAVDMGLDTDGKPLFDPRIFFSAVLPHFARPLSRF